MVGAAKLFKLPPSFTSEESTWFNRYKIGLFYKLMNFAPIVYVLSLKNVAESMRACIDPPWLGEELCKELSDRIQVIL